MCIETGTRKFESNGNEVAITGKSKYSLGALTQTYHVVKKHDFPTEVDVLEWFKSTTINEFITKIDEWLKQFTTEQHEEKSEEQPSKQVEELTEQPEPSEAKEEAHE